MHQVITVIVEAHDVESAVENAESYFDNHLLYGNGGVFDYCTPMYEGFTVSGSDRWIDYQDKQAAFPLASDPGWAEVQDSWNATKDVMEGNLEGAFEAFNEAESVEEVMEMFLEDDGLMRHKLNKTTGYSSTAYYLYLQGWNSGGIRSNRGWEAVKEEREAELESDEDNWWVVPLDVHY